MPACQNTDDPGQTSGCHCQISLIKCSFWQRGGQIFVVCRILSAHFISGNQMCLKMETRLDCFMQCCSLVGTGCARWKKKNTAAINPLLQRTRKVSQEMVGVAGREQYFTDTLIDQQYRSVCENIGWWVHHIYIIVTEIKITLQYCSKVVLWLKDQDDRYKSLGDLSYFFGDYFLLWASFVKITAQPKQCCGFSDNS